MRKFLILYLLCYLVVLPVSALTVDDSVDSQIRKNYKTDVVEKELLPALPKVAPEVSVWEDQSGSVAPVDEGVKNTNIETNVTTQKQRVIPVQNRQQNGGVKQTYTTKNIYSSISQDYSYKDIKLRKGTKFKLRIQNTVAETTVPGTKVSFVSIYPETSRYVTVPAGTVFRGVVTDSHSPQFFGNGGLIELKIDEVLYKGKVYPIQSKLRVANYKRVYLNDIKGKRKYMSNVVKMSKPGCTFMKRMCRVSAKLSDGPEVILSPLALASGLVVCGVNFALSPVLSVFSTGTSIKLPAGTYFEIKITQDTMLSK